MKSECPRPNVEDVGVVVNVLHLLEGLGALLALVVEQDRDKGVLQNVVGLLKCVIVIKINLLILSF